MKTTLEELADQVIETDLLIIGGGLAGAFAVLGAKEKSNVDIAIVEKANMERSGDAGKGLQHYGYINHPLINGVTAEEHGRIRAEDLDGLVSTRLSIMTAKALIKPIVILEEIGVKVREEDGSFKMCVTVGPGSTAKERIQFVHYRGADLKPKLEAAVRKRGAKVFERTMFTSLITKDGSVVGATAVNVRTGKFLVFKSKFVLLATGGMQARLYGSYAHPYVTFPNNLFQSYHCPACTGDGHAAAYRAGAKLVNVEFTHIRNAPLGWDPGPTGALRARIKNSRGEELSSKYPELAKREKLIAIPFHALPFMPDMSKPEIERDVLMFRFDGIPDLSPESFQEEDFGDANVVPHLIKATLARGGVSSAPFEVFPYYHGLVRWLGGVKQDDKGESSLKGLFVAGNVVGGLPLYDATGAYAWGYQIGNYLREATTETKKPVFGREQIRQVQMERERTLAPLGRKDGVNPLQVEDLVQKIMMCYVGIHKIEPKLKRGIEHLQVIKERLIPALMASNPHELMRAIEVRDILEIAEVHARAALLRTETRLPPAFHRVDYPQKDDKNWRNKTIVIYNVGGEMKHTIEMVTD